MAGSWPSFNLPLRLSEKAHLPFGKLTALSKVEGPFDRFIDLSEVDTSADLRVYAEQCGSIKGLHCLPAKVGQAVKSW